VVRLRVVVEPKSPLVLGNGMDTAQNVRESRDYIAGSVLRGALAQQMLEALNLHNTSRRIIGSGTDRTGRADFDAIFTTPPPVRFGFLYPTFLQSDGNACDAVSYESFPSPVTTLACKPHGTKHRMLDTLRATLRGELPQRVCPDCKEQFQLQERVERWRGFVLCHSDGIYDYCKGVPRRPLVRVGLNRWTESAEEQILYVLEAIVPHLERDKPLAFVGFWTMSDVQWNRLKLLLDNTFNQEAHGYRLRLGSARARGLGEVLLWWHNAPCIGISQRLDSFQDSRFQDAAEYLYLSLTARSPVLAYDERGLPVRSLIPEVLRSYLSVLPSALELIKEATFVEPDVLSGWSQAWGLPKLVVSVIAAGSVFTYRAPRSEREAVIAFLTEVETKGVGERRSEGLGDLVACDQFHVGHDAATVKASP
jgi:CRISPR-associated protein Csx10